ncbi:MAG: ABC transporter ATP-binding protein/permease [Acidimicrobiia bacterium]|nr:ABC transporter ATP-binding protein/permease [Acidimicrobiia bacterium]
MRFDHTSSADGSVDETENPSIDQALDRNSDREPGLEAGWGQANAALVEGHDGPVALDAELPLPKSHLAALVLIGLLRALATAGGLLLIRAIVDHLTSERPPMTVMPLVWAFIAVSAGIAVAQGLEYTVSERIGYAQVARVRMVLHAHLLNLPVHKVQRSSQGAILLRFTGDLSTLRTWTSRGLARGIVSSMTLVFGMAVLIHVSWTVALAALGMLLLAVSASIIWGYHVHRTTRAVRWRRSLLASNLAEQIRSLAVVQAFGRAAGEHQRLGRQNADLLGALGRSANARGMLRFLSAAGGYLATCSVLVVGVLLLSRGRITVGGLVAALLAVRQLRGPVQTLGRAHEYWQAARVSKRKLRDYMERSARPDVGLTLEPLRPSEGRIEFHDVSVDGVLENINLTVEPGTIAAIVGPNGTGKSTLLSLLIRANEPDRGFIVVDGQVLADTSARSCVRNIGIMSPDLPLMSGTIRRNLAYRRRKATDEQLRSAIVACRIDEVLESIDGGLDGWVTEGGTNLPAGHRQRIALARAIVGNPRILLLDEPTSNMDAASKEVFRRFLWRYGGTVVLVTHDPQEAAMADEVHLLEQGRIVGSMTGEEARQRNRVEARRQGAR